MARQRKSGSAPKRKPRPKRTNVALHLPTDDRAMYTRCSAMLAAVKADTQHFPAPFPAPAQIEGHLGTLGTALQEAEGGDPSAKAAALNAASKVREDFRQLKAYVQGVLQGMPPADVAPILAAIMMYESRVGVRKPKPPLGIKQGPSGSVVVDALAILDAVTYEWSFSLDLASWTIAGKSAQARFTVSGLTPGKTYWYRVTAFRRDGTTTEGIVAGPFMVT